LFLSGTAQFYVLFISCKLIIINWEKDIFRINGVFCGTKTAPIFQGAVV